MSIKLKRGQEFRLCRVEVKSEQMSLESFFRKMVSDSAVLTLVGSSFQNREVVTLLSELCLLSAMAVPVGQLML